MILYDSSIIVGPQSGVSSSAATPGDMLTPLMALDITEPPTTSTKASPSSAMVSIY